MSKFLNLNLQDILKGLVVAVLSAVLTGVYQALLNQAVIDPRQLLTVGLTAGVGYLIKNYFTDNGGKLLGKY